jgi:DNA uptake protein ComE-like DNA-binding protein
LLILYLSFSDYFFSNEKTDFSKFEKEIASFEASVKQAEDSASSAHEKYFNAENEDDDSIQIAAKYPVRENKQEKPEKRFENKFPKKDASVTVELNSADTTSLKQLKGIGSAFAKRIIKFRESLGGFVKKEQLLEVYGFDKEKYDMIVSQINIDLSGVKKININSASVDDLHKHPYIDKKLAVKIFFQRVNHGSYSDVSDIEKLNLADDEVYSKIAPYLTIE